MYCKCIHLYAIFFIDVELSLFESLSMIEILVCINLIQNRRRVEKNLLIISENFVGLK